MARVPTITLLQFRAEFEEFAAAGDPLVLAKIQDAADAIDPVQWGDLAPQGTKYLAAHLLALSPFGRALKLVAQNGTTVYSVRYDALVAAVGIGGLVV